MAKRRYEYTCIVITILVANNKIKKNKTHKNTINVENEKQQVPVIIEMCATVYMDFNGHSYVKCAYQREWRHGEI